MKTINFMGIRKLTLGMSATLVLVSIIALAVNGLKLGLDFTGGTLIEVKYTQPANLNEIRATLQQNAYHDVSVQFFGSEQDVLVRMSESYRADLGDTVLASLQKSAAEGNKVTLQRAEFVGSQVGEDLRDEGGLALLLAIATILVYVAFRFQMKFSLGAVIALVHDVTITLGVFALFQLEFDLTVLAAILAIIGYSLNDTIVVADRIRENLRMMRETEVEEIINVSLTQTLDRTLMTSGTTMIVVLVLLFMGGELIHNFALALTVGIFVGTYSSIYIAANLLMLMNVTREDLVPAALEEAVDDRP
ncbi:MAG: protein translocase subunit SecF [Oceanospirillaceae bacterium]|nr:protein translocase subunit SecF [Oceanospirillaceae bacterium]MCP5349841.1 protein translocase subunit SecF [Oceanospirillaceae bacterium]